MARLLDTQQYLDTVCQLLKQGERSVAVPVAGSSMVPFLINGDTVFLDLPDTPVRRGDIVLYTRGNGRYILHRVYKVNKDGSYIMVGDAHTQPEVISSREQIHARVTEARHRGKLLTPNSFRWWAYRHLWLWLRPFRPALMRLREKLRRSRSSLKNKSKQIE